MTIKLQLRVSVLISVGLFAALGWILFSTFQQVDGATDRGRLADEIGRGVTDQSFLTSDFLLHREARARVQWNVKHDSLALLLRQSEVDFTSPKDSAVLSTIRQRHASTKDIFSELAIALKKEGNSDRGNTGFGELGERLETQLLIASQEMVSSASQLAERSRQDITNAQDRARWVVVALLTTMGIIVVTVLLWLTKKVLNPIALLHGGTEIIGQGNLDYRIGITSRDEIGELSRAFDHMTSNLDTITASRDELNKEITERKLAEEQAKRSADEARDLNHELIQSNSELEAFSYSVSHDLRAPLRAIDGFSQILMREHSPQLLPQAQHYLGMVRQGAQQMGQLIDNLLAFSRLGRQDLAMRQVDLASARPTCGCRGRTKSMSPMEIYVRTCSANLRTGSTEWWSGSIRARSRE